MAETKSIVGSLKKGDKMSETQYYTVQGITTAGNVEVINERGLQFTIGKGIVEEGIYSASQVRNEESVTRTELIEIFSRCKDTVFTVNYRTKPDIKIINEAIESANKGKFIPIKDLKKMVKAAYDGEERTLVGYLLTTETGFGRSMVIDLEADKSKSTPDWDSRIRQVDHRTLNFLIYKNVKYISRSK